MAFQIPNLATATYPVQAEVDKVDVDILVQGLNGEGVELEDDCEVTAQATPNMTVAVAAGTAIIGGTDVPVAAGNVTITAANASNPRFDLIVVNSSGVKSAQAGTPSATPVFPAVPATSVALAAVYVPAASTSVTTGQIVDKRAVVGAAGGGGGGGSGVAVEEDGTEEGTGILRFNFSTGLNVAVVGTEATVTADAAGSSATPAVGTGDARTVSTLGNGFVVLGRFHVPQSVSINRCWVHIQTQSGNLDVGIYFEDPATNLPDLDNRAISKGSTAVPAAGPPYKAISLTETTLAAGWYWAALSTDNATASFGVISNGNTNLSGQRQASSGAFPLPTTLPALTSGSVIPALMFDHS